MVPARPRRATLTRAQVEMAARTFRVLADPTRRRIIHELLESERTVGALATSASISQSATSHQLAKLRDQSLVVTRRQGSATRWLASTSRTSFVKRSSTRTTP